MSERAKKKINFSLLANLILAWFVLIIELLERGWLGGLKKIKN